VLLGTNAGAQSTATVADAAMRGNLAVVRTLLGRGARRVVNVPQADGSTALHWAAYRGDRDMAAALIAAGADVSALTREGATPLSLACLSGDAAMVSLLLDAGADANQVLRDGNTPLMFAARSGQPAAVRALLDYGAEVDARETLRGTTALMWAASQAHPAAVRLLAEWGADVNARSNVDLRQVIDTLPKGNAPVEGIVIDGRVIKAGTPRTLGAGDAKHYDLTGGGLTPLIFAVRANDRDSVAALLNAGADVNEVSNWRWSPLLVATQNRQYQLGAFLLDHGADPSIANRSGWTPLYIAVDNRNIEGGDYPVRKPDMDHLEFIKQLIAKGADVNAQAKDNTWVRTVFTQQWLNEDGATPFLRAAQSSDVEVMKLLLAHGADPKIETASKVTALQVAAGIGWVEGNTYEWSEAANVEAVKMLLELGLDPNAVAETGRTALHGAALKGRPAIIQMLVDYGAKLDARDYGTTGTDRTGRLALHTWLPVDYADGLVRIGTQMAIARPEAAKLLRTLMREQGLQVPPEGRTIETVCRPPDVCTDIKDDPTDSVAQRDAGR
jgi:ankyrin repeat protein